MDDDAISELEEQIRLIEESVGLPQMREKLKRLRIQEQLRFAAWEKREARRQFAARLEEEQEQKTRELEEWIEEQARQKRESEERRTRAQEERDRERELQRIRAAEERERQRQENLLKEREREERTLKKALKGTETLYDPQTLEEFPFLKHECLALVSRTNPPMGACEECGAEGYMNVFKGQNLCRACFCADDPEACKIEVLKSNYGRTATDYSSTGASTYSRLNATWLLDRYEWAEALLKTLPYKFTQKEFFELRDALVVWSNHHPRSEWRNARSILLVRFADSKYFHQMKPVRTFSGELRFSLRRAGGDIRDLLE